MEWRQDTLTVDINRVAAQAGKAGKRLYIMEHTVLSTATASIKPGTRIDFFRW